MTQAADGVEEVNQERDRRGRFLGKGDGDDRYVIDAGGSRDILEGSETVNFKGGGPVPHGRPDSLGGGEVQGDLIPGTRLADLSR
jgi:hypothetical protein